MVFHHAGGHPLSLAALAAPMRDGAPGFAGTTDLAACKEPARAFRLLYDASKAADGNHTRQGISMEGWVRFAPTMGLADVITADTTFDQLASVDDGDEERTISAEVLHKYIERIRSKSSPGSAKVGGVRYTTQA